MSSSNAHYGVFSDEFKAWISTADIAAMDAMDNMPPAQAREIMTTIETSVPNALKDITYTDHEINKSKVTARIFRAAEPQSPDLNLPIALVLHGGGWMYGGHNTETRLVRALLNSGFLPVSIDYRLAPEHPFPVPLDDCWEGLMWVINHAKAIGGDGSKILLAGSSAGGNLCAVVGLLAREKGINCIKGQILIMPATCHYRHFPGSRFELKSYHDMKDVPVLGAKKMNRFWDSYYPHDNSNWKVSPLLAPNHAGLPPTYIQVAGSDILRDEALAYEKILLDAGVPTEVDIYPGVPHGFTTDLLGMKAGDRAEIDLLKYLRRLLQRIEKESKI